VLIPGVWHMSTGGAATWVWCRSTSGADNSGMMKEHWWCCSYFGYGLGALVVLLLLWVWSRNTGGAAATLGMV
jgi:hypothetical protein